MTITVEVMLWTSLLTLMVIMYATAPPGYKYPLYGTANIY
jgi:hypothetical protein